MEARKGKIGINTLFLIFITITFSPASRLYMNYATQKAGQAGWLSPIVAGVVLYYVLMKLNTLLVNHPGSSLMEIYEKTVGKFIAKIIALIYLIWILIDLGVNLSGTSFRLTSVLYPNIDNNIFIIIFLVIIGGLLLPSGIVVISRMFKMFFWIILFSMLSLLALIGPNVKLEQLMPVSYLDIMPVIEGSTIIIYISFYITILLIWSDDVIGIKDFKKRSKQVVIFMVFVWVSLIAVCIGATSSYIMANSIFPFLTAVEDITILNGAIHGFDVILVVIWILSDIALITCVSMSCIKLIKYLFNIKDASIFINLFTILLYYVTLITTRSLLETLNVNMDNVYYFDIVLFGLIPIIMAWIYKLRSKAAKALLKSQKNS